MVVPALDRLDLLGELASRTAGLEFLGLVGDAEFLEAVPELRHQQAGGGLAIGDRLPRPLLERLLVGHEVAVGDGDAGRADPGDELAGLADLPRQQLGVDRAAIDVAERDPATRQEPVQLDDPAHEVRVGLLPERLAALAEELVDERGDGVGERVGVEQGIVEGVPLPRALEPDLDVVVPPARLLEHPADAVAEVALDLEDQGAGPAVGTVGLPGEELLGERVHAGGGLAGADGAYDQHAGVEAGLGDHEPGGPLALAGHGRMVQLADHDRRRGVGRRRRPAGQPAAARPAHGAQPGPEPDPPDREDEAPGEQHGDAGRGVVPDRERPVERRFVVGHEVERGVVAGPWERRRDGVAEHGAQRSAEQHESPDPHRAASLPAGIHGRERPRRRGRGVSQHATAHATTGASGGGVAPVTVRAPRPAPAGRGARTQDVAVSRLAARLGCACPEDPGAHRPPASFAQSGAASGGAPFIGRASPRDA